MRDFLNSVLAFIASESLTDAEFALSSIQALTVEEYSQATYSALLSVLDSRESVSGVRDRLKYEFLAKDVQLQDVAAIKTSNILVGSEI